MQINNYASKKIASSQASDYSKEIIFRGRKEFILKSLTQRINNLCLKFSGYRFDSSPIF